MSNKRTFVIVTAPYTVTKEPLAAPAILDSILNEHYDVKIVDLNAEFNLNPNQLLANYFLYGTIVKGWAKTLTSYINGCVDRVASLNPTWVGLSLFTMYCSRFAEFFCKALRLKYPNIKIILGGQGLSPNGINSSLNFGLDLKENEIIDTWIKSESEQVLLTVLESKPIEHKVQIEDLDSLKLPCYDNYNFDLYPNKIIPITGSRGCVRKCTFCDIHQHWKKFVHRSGASIVEEMIYQQNKTGISSFGFTDSLVNGSMKAYRDMVSMLANHNENNNNPITWSGQFIFRPKHQMNNTDWDLTKKSGVTELAVGVESLIERIRNDMGKKFSNDDIFYSLEQAQRLNIKLLFLMIVGYVTETEQDHQDQLLLFTKLVPYKDILQISLGTTLGILPGTPLYDNYQKYGIELGKNENTWTVKSINNTYEQRLRRRQELEQHLASLGLVKDLEFEDSKNTMLDFQHSLIDLWK